MFIMFRLVFLHTVVVKVVKRLNLSVNSLLVTHTHTHTQLECMSCGN